MKKIYLLLPAILFSFLQTHAQNKYFVRATIVKKEGDTITGYIERVRDNLLSESITFKNDLEHGEKQQFTPDDLLSFTLRDENIIYEPVTYEHMKMGKSISEKRFATLLLKGYCSLYSLELKDDEINIIFESGNTHAFLAKKEDSFTVLKESEAMVGSLYSLDRDYLAKMESLFMDCPAIDTGMIRSTGFYKKDMIKIFTTYDLCKQPGSQPETYKTIEKIKIKAGAYLGYSIFNAKSTSNSSGSSAGFFIDIINPRVNERVAFSVGFTFTKLKYTVFNSTDDSTANANVTTYGIPLKIIYYLNKRKIAPFLSFGIIPTWSKADFVSSGGVSSSEKDWSIFGSFGPGVFIGKFYAAILAEKEGIINVNTGTVYNFRIGYSF